MDETPIVDFSDAIDRLYSNFIDISRNIEGSLSQSIPRFHSSAANFKSTYEKVKNDEGAVDKVKSLFYELIEKHRQIADPIFDSDTALSDEWLTNTDTVSGPRTHKKKSTGRISLNDIRYKGVVIYVNEANPLLNNVCLPLSEAYIQAQKIYHEQREKDKISMLPYKFLHALYNCFLLAIPDNQPSLKEKILKNIKSLESVVRNGTNETEEKSSAGFVFDSFGKLISGITGGDKQMNLDRVKNLVNGVIAPENRQRLSNAFSTVTKNIESSGDLIKGLQESWKSDEVSSLMETGREALNGVTELFNGKTEPESIGDPSLQE